jgi:uncharacterized protein
MFPDRIVIDTGVLVSHLLLSGSTPSKAVERALALGDLLVSDGLIGELLDVLSRPKFAAYVDLIDRQAFVQSLSDAAEWVPITAHVVACRDPSDDAILALAVSGRADVIVTGDRDLLVLDPFQGVRILTPRAFLDLTARG